MSRLLIIGCGGVAQVAIRKCCQNSEVFTDIMIASRTLSKCDDLRQNLKGKQLPELRRQGLTRTTWKN